MTKKSKKMVESAAIIRVMNLIQSFETKKFSQAELYKLIFLLLDDDKSCVSLTEKICTLILTPSKRSMPKSMVQDFFVILIST